MRLLQPVPRRLTLSPRYGASSASGSVLLVLCLDRRAQHHLVARMVHRLQAQGVSVEDGRRWGQARQTAEQQGHGVGQKARQQPRRRVMEPTHPHQIGHHLLRGADEGVMELQVTITDQVGRRQMGRGLHAVPTTN